MDDKTTGVGGERGGSTERMSGRGEESVTGRASAPRTSAPATRVEDRMTGSTAAGMRSTTTGRTDEADEGRTQEIRAEIEQTREDMSETVNAIQERLRPRNIASSAAESVRHAASDKARTITDSEMVHGMRENPVPTAMIGIGLAGLAWLAFNRSGEQRYRRREYGRSRADWRLAPSYREEDNYYRGFGGRQYETAGTSTPGLSYDAGREYQGDYRTSEYAGREAQTTAGVTERAGEVAEDVRRRARQTTYRAQSQLQRTWNESPLLIGAASAVLGCLVGMVVPETERENRLMGETRDNMVEGVQQMAKDTAKRVQDAATTAATSAAGLIEDKDKNKQPGNTP